MLPFVLDPTQCTHSKNTAPRSCPFTPSICLPKVETLSRQTTPGPRVHGEVDKHRPEPSRPSIIPIPKIDLRRAQGRVSYLTSLVLPEARALCGAEALRLYPIATHSCKHFAKSFISATDSGGLREAAGLPLSPGQLLTI